MKREREGCLGCEECGVGMRRNEKEKETETWPEIKQFHFRLTHMNDYCTHDRRHYDFDLSGISAQMSKCEIRSSSFCRTLCGQNITTTTHTVCRTERSIPDHFLTIVLPLSTLGAHRHILLWNSTYSGR